MEPQTSNADKIGRVLDEMGAGGGNGAESGVDPLASSSASAWFEVSGYHGDPSGFLVL